MDTNNAQSKNRRIYRHIDGSALTEEVRFAYCWYDLHPGFLTPQFVREHKCVEKKCHFLERFKQHPYWAKKIKLKEARIAGKQQKRAIAENEKEILDLLRVATAHVDGLAIASCEWKDGFYLVRIVSLTYIPMHEYTSPIVWK